MGVIFKINYWPGIILSLYIIENNFAKGIIKASLLFWVAHDIAVLWTKLCSFGNLVLKKATSQGITNLFIPLVYLLPIAYKYVQL